MTDKKKSKPFYVVGFREEAPAKTKPRGRVKKHKPTYNPETKGVLQAYTEKNKEHFMALPQNKFFEDCKPGGKAVLTGRGDGVYVGVHRHRKSLSTESGEDTAIVLFPVFTAKDGTLMRRPNYYIKNGRRGTMWNQVDMEIGLAPGVADAIRAVVGGDVAVEDKKEIDKVSVEVAEAKTAGTKQKMQDDLSRFDL